jgi:hypothetical protein
MAGYKISPIILDYLDAYQQPIVLSNNQMKIQTFTKFGYEPKRLKLLGEMTSKSQQEIKQRSTSGIDLDISNELSTIDSELERLKHQIQLTLKEKEAIC